VRANEARLGQIVLNLLLNATHAMKEGQQETNRIRVGTRAEAGQVVIEVSDNGPGIPPELAGRVFDPFFTTKPRGIGTGLGLAMVHGVVTELGGTVGVDTALGEGTRFTVRLPPSVAERPAGSDTADLEPASTRRVLVIDDDPLILSTLRRALEGAGHAVEGVDGGAAARAWLEADADFDVVFCDLLMPGTTGMDLHQWCAEAHPELAERFVFMSGGVFTSRVHAFLRSVDNPVVDKPFDVERVLRVTRRIARGLRGRDVLERP
jgi:CheY-like chemotaxis protein